MIALLTKKEDNKNKQKSSKCSYILNLILESLSDTLYNKNIVKKWENQDFLKILWFLVQFFKYNLITEL